MRYRVEFSCVSHIGYYRKVNQDNFLCVGRYMDLAHKKPFIFPIQGEVPISSPTLFGVFDGMGGGELGEVAAYMAAREVHDADISQPPKEFLRELFRKANSAICTYADQNAVQSMGTTAALLLFDKNSIWLANIGDSKIFRYSNTKLEQISRDHVYQISIGGKPPLVQYLGISPSEMEIHPYISTGPCQSGDIYICAQMGSATC